VKIRATSALTLAAACALLLAGCGLIQGLEGGGSGGSTSAATSTVAAGTGAAQGINCGVDPNTSATLCLGITTCPGLTIDQEVYPECGFLVQGSVVNVECSCGGYLCPLGTTTCTDAQTLLAQSNEGQVCAKVSDGSCIEGTPATTASTTAGATTSAGTTSVSSGGSCTQCCISSCDNDPVCLQACGC
jgi:hypothetical protein